MRPPSDHAGPWRRRRLVLGAVAGLAVWAGVVAYVVATHVDDAPPARGDGLRADALPAGLERTAAPRIALRSARGERVDTAALAGRPFAVTFLYARCGDVCPLIGQELRAALAQLGPAARETAVVAVSVDPRGDTPETVRAWLERQRMPAGFAYLIGSQRRPEPVWHDWFVAPQIPGRPETSTHTASIWLVDARGRRRGVFPGGRAAARDIAHDLRMLIAEARADRAAAGAQR